MGVHFWKGAAAALLLANLGLWAWHQGLGGLVAPVDREREPERMRMQEQPQSVQVLGMSAAPPTSVLAPPSPDGLAEPVSARSAASAALPSASEAAPAAASAPEGQSKPRNGQPG
jgi:hypothetical protein